MKKKIHWATKLKNEIKRLRKKCDKYYEANYEARTKVLGFNNEVYAGERLSGFEEAMPVTDPEGLKQIILDLPV